MNLNVHNSAEGRSLVSGAWARAKDTLFTRVTCAVSTAVPHSLPRPPRSAPRFSVARSCQLPAASCQLPAAFSAAAWRSPARRLRACETTPLTVARTRASCREWANGDASRRSSASDTGRESTSMTATSGDTKVGRVERTIKTRGKARFRPAAPAQHHSRAVSIRTPLQRRGGTPQLAPLPFNRQLNCDPFNPTLEAQA